MKESYKVITLCGSTKFKNEFLEVQKNLTLKGYLVFSPCVFSHSDDTILTKFEEDRLNKIHRQNTLFGRFR